MASGLSKVLWELSKIIPPPEYLLISEWADKYAFLPAEGNSESGKYLCKRMPYQRDMLNDPLDSRVVEIYWQIASQLGKTLCIVIIIEFHVDHAPCAMQVVYPTLDSAKSWMREKLLPTIKDTPKLKGKLKEIRAKDSESTTLNRKFAGGNLTALGANSPSGFRQRSKKISIQDEIDAYETTAEGDPVSLGDRATITFHDAIRLKSSTVTLKGISRIEAGIERSDKQMYFLPCWKCGTYQTLKHVNFKFTFKQEDGSEKRDTENAVFVCENPACGAHWSDQQRLAAIFSGHPDNPPVIVNQIALRAEWRATAPFTGIRGRLLSGYYQTIGKKRSFKSYLHQFAEQFLVAKAGGKETLRVWTNIFLNEAWEESAEQVQWSPLLERCEDYEGELPIEVCLLTASGDVQKDRIELLVKGWGDEEESWQIEKHVIYGDFDLPEIQKQVSDYLDKKFKHPSGVEIPITATAIDSGHKTKSVYKFCRDNFSRRIYAVKGSNAPNSPLVTPHKNKHYGIWLYSVGTDTAKDSIFSRLKIEDAGARFIHFPIKRGFNEAYFKQLCSEKLQTYMEKGQVRRKWIKQFERNEALDLEVYNLAAMDILKPKITKIRAAVIPKQEVTTRETTEYVIKKPEPPKVEQPKQALPQRPRMGRQNGFVGQRKGWL
jgi:phage terminase large subunit GpA-like protein